MHATYTVKIKIFHLLEESYLSTYCSIPEGGKRQDLKTTLAGWKLQHTRCVLMGGGGNKFRGGPFVSSHPNEDTVDLKRSLTPGI